MALPNPTALAAAKDATMKTVTAMAAAPAIVAIANLVIRIATTVNVALALPATSKSMFPCLP